MNSTKKAIKKKRKKELDQESDQENKKTIKKKRKKLSFFLDHFLCLVLVSSSFPFFLVRFLGRVLFSCILTFLFSFINSHLRSGCPLFIRYMCTKKNFYLNTVSPNSGMHVEVSLTLFDQKKYNITLFLYCLNQGTEA